MKIVAVRKNEDGDITAVKLDNGEQLNYAEALTRAKQGKIEHIDVFTKYGREILRSEPDGIEDNNLDNMPSF